MVRYQLRGGGRGGGRGGEGRRGGGDSCVPTMVLCQQWLTMAKTMPQKAEEACPLGHDFLASITFRGLSGWHTDTFLMYWGFPMSSVQLKRL